MFLSPNPSTYSCHPRLKLTCPSSLFCITYVENRFHFFFFLSTSLKRDFHSSCHKMIWTKVFLLTLDNLWKWVICTSLWGHYLQLAHSGTRTLDLSMGTLRSFSFASRRREFTRSYKNYSNRLLTTDIFWAFVFSSCTPSPKIQQKDEYLLSRLLHQLWNRNKLVLFDDCLLLGRRHWYQMDSVFWRHHMTAWKMLHPSVLKENPVREKINVRIAGHLTSQGKMLTLFFYFWKI